MKFNIVLIIISLGLILSNTNERVKRKLNENLYNKLGVGKYLLKGYDLRKSDPMKSGVDDGLAKTQYIFSLTAEESHWDIKFPNIKSEELTSTSGIRIDTTFTREVVKHNEETNSMDEFQRKMLLKLGMDEKKMSYIPFSASASFEFVKKKSLEEGKKIEDTYEECSMYTLSLDFEKRVGDNTKILERLFGSDKPDKFDKSHSHLRLSKEFHANLRALPQKFDEKNKEEVEQFKEFFDTFGTHYLTKMIVGKRQGKRITSDSTVYKTSSSHSVKLSAEVSGVGGKVENESKDGNESSQSRVLSNEYTVGDCTDITKALPIKYEMRPILDLITQTDFGFKFEGLNEKILCEFGGGICRVITPFIAVTKVHFEYRSMMIGSDILSLNKNVCPEGYSDATKLIHYEGNMEVRVDIHSGGWGVYVFVCQKTENVAMGDGTIKPFLSATSPPRVYQDLKDTEGLQCFKDENGNPVDLSSNGFDFGNYVYICWKTSTNIKQDPKNPNADYGAVTNLAVDGDSSKGSYSKCTSDSIKGKFTMYYTYPKHEKSYRCFCTDLNSKTMGSFYVLCNADSLPHEQKKRKMLKKK